MIYVSAVLIWYIVGIFVMRRFEGGWLIMITDRRNTHQQWLTFPALFLTWTLWPVCERVARRMFYTAMYLDARKRDRSKMEDYIFPASTNGLRGSTVEKLPNGSPFIDYDINSMYWEAIHPIQSINDEKS